MKRTILIIAISLFLFFATIVCSYGALILGGVVEPAGSMSQFSDFFPTSIGACWQYKITLSDGSALYYRNVQGKIGMSAITRGRFYEVVSEGIREYNLTLKVKGPAPKQGPLSFLKSVELSVVKDELGIYDDCSNIYWAIPEYGNYAVALVTTNLADPDNYSMRFFFFIGETNLNKSYSKEFVDSLRFIGRKGSTLHFKREVKEDRTSSKVPGFTEDYYFEKNKGLTKLIQKVKGRVTMTWDLVNFTPFG